MRRILLVTAILMATVLSAQAAKNTIKIERIDPTDWYVGMKNPSLQLMVYGKNIRSVEQVTTDYPKELSGNYFARKIDGMTNANATIKIYREGDGYGLNVYSSNITRKYTFTYNSSTGEIISNELGSGKARVKELTNETEIVFTGWELLK